MKKLFVMVVLIALAIVVAFYFVDVFEGSGRQKTITKEAASQIPDFSDSIYLPLEELYLEEEWAKTIKTFPVGMTRHYIEDSLNRRDVYFRRTVLRDEQESDSAAINTTYYIRLDEGIFLAERYIFNKTNHTKTWVEFDEGREFYKLICYIKKMEQ